MIIDLLDGASEVGSPGAALYAGAADEQRFPVILRDDQLRGNVRSDNAEPYAHPRISRPSHALMRRGGLTKAAQPAKETLPYTTSRDTIAATVKATRNGAARPAQ